MSIQNRTNIKYILTIAHERVSDKINILFDSIKDIVTVFFRQGRKIDTNTRNIHALTASQSSFVLHFTKQIISGFINDFQFQITIVNQNRTTDIQIVYKIGI